MYSIHEIENVDPEIAKAIEDEIARQNSHIELIASGELGETKLLWLRWDHR